MVWDNYSLGKGISNLCPKRSLTLSLKLSLASFHEPEQYLNKDHRAELYFVLLRVLRVWNRGFAPGCMCCAILQLSRTPHPPACYVRLKQPGPIWINSCTSWNAPTTASPFLTKSLGVSAITIYFILGRGEDADNEVTQLPGHVCMND